MLVCWLPETIRLCFGEVPYLEGKVFAISKQTTNEEGGGY
jgi:hypothetical protein